MPEVEESVVLAAPVETGKFVFISYLCHTLSFYLLAIRSIVEAQLTPEFI